MSAKPSTLDSSIQLNPDAIPRCNTHKKRLKFFCSKHALLLCSVCAVKRHRSCDDVLTINEASEDKQIEGNKLLDEYNQKKALIENAVTERKAAKKLLDTNAQEIESEVHEITEKLIDLVKQEERTLLEIVQAMKGRESETLDRDISGLEETFDELSKSHDTLSQNLKFSDVDLIQAVIKEKQKSEDDVEIENILKRRFKEIYFRFIVSPHITSFLKHFKNLGQIMMSEDSRSSVHVARSNMSTPVNEMPSPPRYRNDSIHSIHSLRQQRSLEQSHLSAREKWIRDRQKQMESSEYGDSTSNNSNEQSSTLSQIRRTLPMRALPLSRPETPEVYSRSTSQLPRQEFIPRPISTPPVESPRYSQSPKTRDVNRFNSINRYSSVRPEAVYIPERGSHTPMHNPLNDLHDMHYVEPVHVFQRRTTSDPQSPNHDRPDSPWAQTPQHQTPSAQQHTYAVVRVKDTDTCFGRSFAAVQINDPRLSPNSANKDKEQNSLHTYQRTAIINTSSIGGRDRSPPSNGASAVFTVYPPNTDRQQTMNVNIDNSPRLNESRGFSPSTMQNSMATGEEKIVRRWVHQTSFTSNGMGPKRLISGIGLLYDGRVVFVDQEHYTVQLYNSNHRFVSELKLDSRPFDLSVISDTKIVVSLQSERVLKFILVTVDGLTSVADLGVPCDMVCYGVCRGGGHYCVCCGEEVWILSEEGRVVNKLKMDKVGTSLFVQAEYVSMDRSGTILFVSDAGSNKVLAIQVDGRRLWEFTYEGFKPAGLKCVDIYIYVCDRDQHRVLMLNMEGHVVKQSVLGRIENPRALCFHNAGTHLLVTQMRYDAIISVPRPIHVYNLK